MTDKAAELEEALDALREKTVFFGHQSVGGNVLDGLPSIQGFDIPVVDIRSDVPVSETGAFLHAYVGRNVHPDEKVADFSQIIRSELDRSVDIAFLKFCYVDVNGPSWDGEKIFDLYLEEMEQLESDFPETTFVYLTMPLMTPGSGIKDLAKRFLGRASPSREGNIERNRFNDLLRDAKGSTGRLFDIAAIEATRPDGERETIRIDGQTYDVMYKGYTTDGGHLNARGSSLVARELVTFLGGL